MAFETFPQTAVFRKTTTLKHYLCLNCLFIQFVEGFEWAVWGRSMEASQKQSHTARKDEPPPSTRAFNPEYVIYFGVTVGEKGMKWNSRWKRRKRRRRRRKNTTGSIFWIQRLSVLVRWWRLEVGRKGRGLSSSSETELNFEFLGKYKILLHLKKKWKPQNPQWEKDERGGRGEFRLFKFQVALQPFTPSFPPLCQELPRASFVPADSKYMKTPRDVEEGSARSGRHSVKFWVNVKKKRHLFLYLQHTSTWAAISKPAAIWVSFLQMFVSERNGTNSNVEGKRKRLIKVEPGENYSLKTLLPYWLQLHILGWHSQTIIQDQHSKSKQKP